MCWMECTAESSFGNLIEAFAAVARANGVHPLAGAFEDPHGALDARLQRCAAALARARSFFSWTTTISSLIRSFTGLSSRSLSERPIRASFWHVGGVQTSLPRSRRARSRSYARGGLGRRELPIPFERGEHRRLLICSRTGLASDGRRSSEGARTLDWPYTSTYNVEYLLTRLPPFQEQLKEQWLQPLLGEIPPDARSFAIALSVLNRPHPGPRGAPQAVSRDRQR